MRALFFAQDHYFDELSHASASKFLTKTTDPPRWNKASATSCPVRSKSIVSDKVLSEVIVETSIGDVASVITTRSVEEMKLKPGDEVFALIKATNVSLRRRS
jgi:molybdopterin-binding protein